VWTITAVALALQAAVAVPVDAECTSADARLIAFVADEVRRAGRADTGEDVERRLQATKGRCDELVLLETAMRGWGRARALSTSGGGDHGDREAIRQILAVLDLLARGPLAMDAEYAGIAVRAAIAAAQDERGEMELLLTHARDLAERLAARGRRGLWPRPFNLLAGELWLEVDRYDEARDAYERAVRDDPSPLALVGLGRTLTRLQRHDEACKAFRSVRGATQQLQKDLSVLVAGCP
jgi:tetratricopeptide (TPR) repeat protein